MIGTESYLIWSNQRGMWWRPGKRGYTAHIDEAGTYDPVEARQIVDHATCGGQLVHDRVNPATGERYTEMDEVIILAHDAMGAHSELLAEVEQLRYERRLLGFARMTLDLVASGRPDRWEHARIEAADIAQRIVDEIGHPVTDEDAPGPDMRQQIAALTAEVERIRSDLTHLADVLDSRVVVAAGLMTIDDVALSEQIAALITSTHDAAARLHEIAGTSSVYGTGNTDGD